MTLRVRFALWAATLFAVVLLISGMFVYMHMQQGLNSAIDDSLQLSASQIVSLARVEDGLLVFRADGPDSDAANGLRRARLTVRILDGTGHIRQSSGRYDDLPVPPEILTAGEQGRASFSTVYDPENRVRVRIYSVPIIEDDQLIGIVQVARSLTGVDETLRRLLSTLLLAGPVLILAAAFGSYLLCARALAPIDQITCTARRISAESLSSRIGSPVTNDEIGRLVATFDEMLARLDKAFRREHQFVADASHELRTPLAAMQAILSVTAEKERSPEEYRLAIADMAAETERLRGLVENLLQLARGEGSQIGMPEDVDLTTLLRELAGSLRPLAEARGLTLTCEVPEALSLRGDPDALIRLFVNLLDNAVKYTAEGRVTLTATRIDGRIRIAVADSGTGIPPEHLDHVFDRFYRVEKSRSGSGAGLGLAIALDIARAHGGTLEVQNAPGGGAVFTVNLPEASAVAT